MFDALFTDNKLKEFFIRARTLEQMAEFDRLRRLSEARHEDIKMLHRRREERIKVIVAFDLLLFTDIFKDSGYIF